MVRLPFIGECAMFEIERTSTNDAVRIPRTVWMLGFVSMFMDISSEIVHALLPLFLTGTLGASVAMVGLIDGVAEAAASITKVFSGYISDRIGKRKPLILLGYGLGALSKPFFAVAGSSGLVLAARFADRIGKGLRGAPRDALVADVTPTAIRGRAFGLRQSLDTIGAFVGPLVAIGLMALFLDDIRKVFWFAIIPGIVAVLLVLGGIEDRRLPEGAVEAPPPVRFGDLAQFSSRFWGVVAMGALFTMARFSEAFLILKTNSEGLPIMLAPMVLVVMNLVYSLGAYPAGVLSDRFSSRHLLIIGLLPLMAADLLLAMTSDLAIAFAGIALWGAHMAMTQGLMAKLVTDKSPPHLRGSAFGIFNLVSGIAMLLANVVAGTLWTSFGPSVTFITSAAFAGATIVTLGLANASRALRA